MCQETTIMKNSNEEVKCEYCTRLQLVDAISILTALKGLTCYQLYHCGYDCRFVKNVKDCGIKKSIDTLEQAGIKL